MIAILKPDTTPEQQKNFTDWLKFQGVDVHISNGQFQTVIGLIGDTSKLDADLIGSLSMVESVKRVSDPFKSANRKFHPDDSVIDPSHATDSSKYVKSMALAAVAAGADGLMTEVHSDPIHALCDGAQSLTPEQFDSMMKAVISVRAALKEIL